MGLNPFILKAKRKLLEGYNVGDDVHVCWKSTEVRCIKGKITELTDWIAVQGTSKTSFPITMLESIERA